MSSTSPSIADQVGEFNVGFNEAVGPRLAEVFRTEQADLNAGGLPEGTIAVGDVLPDADLQTPDGSATTLVDEIGDQPAVVVLYRGAWCPYCDITLKTYQRELLPALEERGVRLIAISPQTPEASAKAVENGELGFTVLGDPGAAFIRRIGLITEPSAEARSAHTDLGFDVADSNADATAAIPFPTAIVVDDERTVRFLDVHVDYTTRTEVPAIVDAVDALPAASLLG